MDAHQGRGKPAGYRDAEEQARQVELGDLSRASSDYRSAVSHYRKAVQLLGEGDSAVRVSALRRLADALMHTGDTARAQATLQEAVFAADSSTPSVERAGLEIQLGKVHLTCGRTREASEHVDRAAELLKDRPPCTETGFAYNLKGVIALRLGEHDTAMGHYRSALAIFKEVGDLQRVAHSYYNIGLLYKNACRWTQALENFQVAHSLMATEGGYHDLPQVMQGLGLVHLKMGNLAEAHQQFNGALEKFREVGDTISMARAMLGEAEVLRLSEDTAAARELFREALEICLGHQYVREAGIAYLGLSEVALTEKDFDEARRTVARAAEAADNLGGKGDLAAEVHTLQARIALAESDAEGALEDARTSLTLSAGSGDRIREARALTVLARIQGALRSADDASKLFEQSQRILRDVGEQFYLAETLCFHGAMLVSSGDDRDRLRGLQMYLEARECFRSMALPLAEARVLLRIAEQDVRQGTLDRAAERLEAVAVLHEQCDFPGSLSEEIRALYERLEGAYVNTAIATRESVDARRQMEEILRSEQSLAEKVSDFLGVLGSAIPSDGACLARIKGDDLHVIGARNIPDLVAGERYAIPPGFKSAGWPQTENPLVFMGIEGETGMEALRPLSLGRDLSSAVAVPLGYTGKHWSVLYIDRTVASGQRHFHQAEISYCMALARQLAGFLEEASIKNQRGLRDMRKMDRHIALADIVTQNAEMQSILGLVGRVADSDLTVLLQGETGTGKKLVAKAIHECSPRSEQPFVTVDCAALPESILESELFGYKKGAFTGAVGDREGILEHADGGTIFLDEIDKMGIAVQRRFLHLLDCGEVRPVGGREYHILNIRVVCATSSSDIRAEVERGEFIKDLYFRLNDVSIRVPVLRRRKEDIPLLAEYFVEIFSQETGRQINGISRMAMKKLIDYEWPGNVRELEKAMRRAVTLADDGETIGIDLLPPRFLEDSEKEIELSPEQGSLKQQLEGIEQQFVLKALQQFSWNKSRTAAHLGLSRKGLKNKITRYGLDRRARPR